MQVKKKAKVFYLENEPKGLNYKHQVLKYIILHGYYVKSRKKLITQDLIYLHTVRWYQQGRVYGHSVLAKLKKLILQHLRKKINPDLRS